MKIAIDLRPLQIGHQNRGIGAYLLNLLQQLPDNEDVSFVFVRYNTSSPIYDFDLEIPGGFEEVVLKKYSFSKKPLQLFRYATASLFPTFSKLRRHHPDVFFQVDYLLGTPKIHGCRTVVVAHDLIPFHFKQIYLPSWKKYYGFRQFKLKSRVRLMLRAWFYEQKYKKAVRVLKRASRIISVSKNTKDDLITLLGIRSNAIQVVYSAPSFREDAKNRVISTTFKKTIDALDGNYVCYIGGTDLRRQIDELVYVFNLYNARVGELNLVLAGNEFKEGSTEINPNVKQAIEKSSYKDHLYTFGKITEAEKKYLLGHARAFVFPTLYEGFGLPMLEAMQVGTPVIAYRNSSLIELGEGSVLFTETMDGQSLYEAIQRLIPDRPLRESLSKHGKEQSSEFDWSQTSLRIWKVLSSE